MLSANAQFWLAISTIAAVILGPILAVQADKYLQTLRDRKTRKAWIFRELMVTRSTTLSPRHVEALNGIQMEFAGDNKREREVIDAWQLYLTNLNDRGEPQAQIWAARVELLHELLHKMAISLKYTHFNKARIKNEGYIPQYFADIEKENNELRKSAAEVFSGRERLKVEVHEPRAAQDSRTVPQLVPSPVAVFPPDKTPK
jgi:hypothetical protein